VCKYVYMMTKIRWSIAMNEKLKFGELCVLCYGASHRCKMHQKIKWWEEWAITKGNLLRYSFCGHITHFKYCWAFLFHFSTNFTPFSSTKTKISTQFIIHFFTSFSNSFPHLIHSFSSLLIYPNTNVWLN